MTTPSESVIIVGAGVFGLTTALHLARRGYRNVDIFDKQPYHLNGYAFSAGCDTASADENKILRASYGSGKAYQDLAFRAMSAWEEWNHDLATSSNDDLSAGLSNTDKLWENCGFLRVSDSYEKHEVETQENFPQDIKHTQYRVSDPKRVQDALDTGIPKSKLDPFGRQEDGLKNDGVLDMTAGYVLASKACAYALHLCQKAGVRLHLGPEEGTFVSFIKDQRNAVKGIITADGKSHPADLVVVAAGGWTPSLVPQTNRLLETTAGSVIIIKLPHDRPDLWAKYDPSKFPVWSWRMQTYKPGDATGGLYGFPRTKDGLVKFGFRGAKWTNYTWPTTSDSNHQQQQQQQQQQQSTKKISYPLTSLSQIPSLALSACRSFCAQNLPDLLSLPLHHTRLCWYTDSVDNNFLITAVPSTPGLVVASGGSGHGFKFLPVLGDCVVDVLEGKKTEFTELWGWREGVRDGGKANGLEEGEEGWRTLDKQKLVGKREWKL